jgi:hypothetical protein
MPNKKPIGVGMLAVLVALWSGSPVIAAGPQQPAVQVPDGIDPAVNRVITINPNVHGAQAAAIVKRMEAITIPQLEFQDANLVDVVAFLNKVSVDADKTAKAGAARGVNFVLNLRGRNVAPLTFSAREVSLMTALRVITKLSGMQYTVQDNVVMIEPREEAGSK